MPPRAGRSDRFRAFLSAGGNTGAPELVEPVGRAALRTDAHQATQDSFLSEASPHDAYGYGNNLEDGQVLLGLQQRTPGPGGPPARRRGWLLLI